MAKVLKCRMTASVDFVMRGDSEGQIFEWINTHTPDDVLRLSKSAAMDYNNEVLGEADDKPVDIDIASTPMKDSEPPKVLLVSNIEWCTDEEDEEYDPELEPDLPECEAIPASYMRKRYPWLEDSDATVEDYLDLCVDYLSEKYGFLILECATEPLY